MTRVRALKLLVLLVASWTSGGEQDGEDLGCPECDRHDEASEALTSLLQLSHVHQRGPPGLPEEADWASLADCKGFECLKGYVDMPDPAYAWADTGLRLNGTSEGVGWTGHMLNMTSQRWLSVLDTKSPAWSHGLVVVVPANAEGPPSLAAGWATLYVSLGWYGSASGPALSDLQAGDTDIQAAAAIAARTAAPVAVLYSVPPMVEVSQDRKLRFEDDLMSYGMLRFLRDGRAAMGPRWLVELPMTKAVVRALDTVSAFSQESLSWSISTFAVMGASKRGTVSWHVAAVDARVKAIVPIGKPLNTSALAQRTIQSYGGLPVVAAPYVAQDLVDAEQNIALVAEMRRITDPIFYVDRYSGVAKFVVDAARDDYFMPDHAAHWWSKVPGQKLHLMVTEGGHIVGEQAVLNLASPIAAFIRSQQLGAPPPELSWTVDLEQGRIEARLAEGAPQPLSVSLWQARTCDGTRRDFRLRNYDVGANCTRCGTALPAPAPGAPAPTCENTAARWQGAALAETAPGSREWLARVEPPADGRWAAFFIQFEFPGPPAPAAGGTGLDTRWKLSTEVAVVPDTYPFPAPNPQAAAMETHLALLSES